MRSVRLSSAAHAAAVATPSKFDRSTRSATTRTLGETHTPEYAQRRVGLERLAKSCRPHVADLVAAKAAQRAIGARQILQVGRLTLSPAWLTVARRWAGETLRWQGW